MHRVQGLGFGGWSLEFRFWGLGCVRRTQGMREICIKGYVGFGFGIWGLEFGAWGLG